MTNIGGWKEIAHINYDESDSYNILCNKKVFELN